MEPADVTPESQRNGLPDTGRLCRRRDCRPAVASVHLLASSQGGVCHDEQQQHKHFNWAIYRLYSYHPPAPPRHRPRTRRQTLQNLHLLPELEATHVSQDQADDDNDDDDHSDGRKENQ